MSPAFGFALDQGQLVSLITFILVCLLLVSTVTALNAAVDLLLVEIDFRRGAQIALGQLASVAETSEDAIITKDLDGIITSWNKGAERIFGYEADEMIGKPINLLIPPDRPDEEPSILARLRKWQRIEHYETVRRRKDGELIDISLSGTFSNVVQCPLSARSRRSPMLRNRHHPLRKHTSPPWCARHGLEPLPASAETVAAYSGVRCDQDLEKNSVVSHLTVAVHELYAVSIR